MTTEIDTQKLLCVYCGMVLAGAANANDALVGPDGSPRCGASPMGYHSDRFTVTETRVLRGLSVDSMFFFDRAGWSRKPDENPFMARVHGAENLAEAEGMARRGGYYFDWDVDDEDSSSFSDDTPAWPLYVCTMRNDNGEAVQSLSGCDFGTASNGPYGDYRRVVEAELALQQYGS